MAGVVHFSPPEDQRINVTAKLGVPRPGAYGGAGGGKAPAAGGSLTLRYQPDPAVPYTFVDIKARTRGASSAAAVRGCLFDPRSNLAVWAELPVVGASASSAPPGAALRLGAKYSSPALSAGAVVNPAQSTLSHAFVVAKAGGLVFGAQTAPMLQLGLLFAGGGRLDGPTWAEAARQCQLATSYAVAYQPSPGSAYGGRFTAAVELVGARGLRRAPAQGRHMRCGRLHPACTQSKPSSQLLPRAAPLPSILLCPHLPRPPGARPGALHLLPAPPGRAAARAQPL